MSGFFAHQRRSEGQFLTLWRLCSREWNKIHSLNTYLLKTPRSQNCGIISLVVNLPLICASMLLSCFSRVLRPHGLQPTRLLCPWDSPGKNTGAGCHSLLQGIFRTQGLNLGLLHWQVDSLPSEPPGKPQNIPELLTLALTTLWNNESNENSFKVWFLWGEFFLLTQPEQLSLA